MDYVYAVARIRSKEMELLSQKDLDQLLSSKSFNDCLSALSDKGWADNQIRDIDLVLKSERKKMWDYISELVGDTSVFDVFLYLNDFHNLKAAIKYCYAPSDGIDIFIEESNVKSDTLVKAIQSHDWELIPEHMRKACKEAFGVLLETGDGQLCDAIIDKTALEQIYRKAKESKSEVIKKYAEVTVAVSDIKIALRAERAGKTTEFLDTALCECDTLNIDSLKAAALSGFESILEYLTVTDYSDGVEELEKSISAFERYSDNKLMDLIKPQKYIYFGIDPIAAYILAKENEIKTVRIILSGKLNSLSEEAIKERVREMYV